MELPDPPDPGLPARAAPVIDELLRDTSQPATGWTGLTIHGRTVSLVLPAGAADGSTALAVLREILGGGSAEPDRLRYDTAARWWNELSGGQAAARSDTFWRSRAEGWDAALPGVATPVTTPMPEELSIPLERALYAGLLEQRLAPPPAWLLACWQLLVRRRTGLPRLVTGVATDLRRLDELRSCRGPLTAYLPVPSDAGQELPLAQHVRRAAAAIDDGAARAEWFDWESAVPDAGAGFGTGFAWLTRPAGWPAAGGTARVRELRSTSDSFVLLLTCEDTEGEGQLRLSYDAAAVRPELAAELFAELPRLLAAGLREPNRPAARQPNNRAAEDRAADRPEAERPAPTGYQPLTTWAERVLAEVWAETLELDRVGVHDNFFAIGGDSILSILVASRAARRGLRVSLRHFFQYQTIATMAPHAEPIGGTGPGTTGGSGLTPAQLWFFDQPMPRRGHWNQGWLLSVPPGLDPAALDAAVLAVVRHHPALRTRFHPSSESPGGWRPEEVEAGRLEGAGLRRIAVDPADWSCGLAAALAGLQDIDLAVGPPLRVALLDGGAPNRWRLALLAHHLAVDTVSWQLLFEDLRTAYRQVRGGQPVALPAATMPPHEWGAALTAARDRAAADLDHWLEQCPADLPGLPVDMDAGEPLEADRRELTTVLDRNRTGILLRSMPVQARVDYVLVTALARAVAEWTGRSDLQVTLDGQGRAQDLVPDAELYRSVGWFTALAPLLVRLPAGDDPLAALRAVRERIHAMPHAGVSYGVLRYLDPVHGPALAARPHPQVSVNYVGRQGGSTGTDDGLALAPAPEPLPSLVSASAPRPWLWGVNAAVRDDRLHVTVDYAGRHYRPGTARRLVDGIGRQLAALIDAWRADGGRTLAPADFPLVNADDRQAVVAQALARAPRRGPATEVGTA